MAEQTYKFADGSGINSTNQVVRDASVAPPPVAPATPVDVKTPNIPVEQVKNTQALNLPTPNTDTNVANGVVAGVQAGQAETQKFMDQVDMPETETQNTQSALIKSINDLLPKTAGKESATAKQEEKLGVNKYKTQIAALNAEIQRDTAAYEHQFNQQELANGVPSLVVKGRQAALQRTAASNIAMKNARLLGLQGMMDSAIEMAKKAVDLQYESVDDDIRIKTEQLKTIEPLLEKDEAQQAEALKLKLETEKAELEEKKTKQKNNVELSFALGTKSQFANKNGEIFRTADGLPIKDPAEFFKLAGVSSFEEAYRKGIVTDITTEQVAEREMVSKMANEYYDAGILPSDSIEVATEKLQNSAKYQKDTYIQPESNNNIYVPGIGELSNMQLDNINPLVTSFQNNEQVKNYNTVLEQVNYVNSLGESPTDDQARIYSFAKVMDPTSAVKEGEYKSVQEYSTALLERYGLKAKRIFDNKGILTPEARRFMQTTLESKLASTEHSYKNIYDETARRVEIVGGLPEGTGKDFLTNFGGAALAPEGTGSGDQLTVVSNIVKTALQYNYSTDEIIQAIRNSSPENAKSVDDHLQKMSPQELVDRLKTYSGTGSTTQKTSASVQTPVAAVAQRKFPTGSKGGQCTTFLHKLVDFPPIGDGKQQKIASVLKFGVPRNRWQPRVGDVVVTGENKTYGHTFLVNKILPGGKVQVTESNYNMDEKVTHNRIVSINDPKIYGAIRGKLKING